MPKKFYQKSNGDLAVWTDPQIVSQSELQTNLPVFQELRALSDEARTQLAISGMTSIGVPSFGSLQELDDWLDDEIDRILDVLDYFDYTTSPETISAVFQGAWFTPEFVESASHEEVGNPKENAIDGDFGNWWQSDQSGTRSIVFRLRSYSKKLEKIRLRSPVTDLRTQLQGVTIKASKALGMIDDPGNVLETDVDFTYIDNVWLEHTLATIKSNARYIKLEVASSLFVASPEQVRIRGIEAWVGIINHAV